MLKLNLGCGARKVDGWTGVDSSALFNPDVVCDLEKFPWPWENDSVDEILLIHTLEHLGQETRVFLEIMRELYRVCCDGAKIHIAVPHPRHDHFICDPTHVRIITPTTLLQFDREKCEEWVRANNSNSKLALELGVDFKIENVEMVLDEPYATDFNERRVSAEEIDRFAKQFNNVVKEYRIVLTVLKD